MFVSKEHHPQVLDRACYHSQQQFDKELAELFLPSWHCVAVRSELPRDGAFVTLELFGNPIILWRKEGQVHAFLNVCAHRYSTLTHAACGVVDRLKCKYHGWEYDQTGNVRRIPDARCFRPLEPGMLGLRQYRAALCGELIFVSLADEPPSLREFLGPAFDTYADWFTPEMHTATVCDRVIDANWKVLVENALESYHTTEVHPKTFGEAPAEEDCTHELHERSTSLTVSYEHERSFRQKLDGFGHWLVGLSPQRRYSHIVHYPNVMLSQLSLYRWVECIVPISPTQSRSVVRVMCHIGRPGSMRRLWNRRLISRWANTFLMQVGAEDEAVLPGVQRGLSAVDQPLGGLISTREERVVHFQNYVQASLPAEPQPAAARKPLVAETIAPPLHPHESPNGNHAHRG